MNISTAKECAEKYIQLYVLKLIYDKSLTLAVGDGLYDKTKDGFVPLPSAHATQALRYVTKKPELVKKLLDDMIADNLIVRQTKEYFHKERQKDEKLFLYKPTPRGFSILNKHKAL